MNYGREGIKKREEELLALSPKIGRKTGVWSVKIIMIALLAVIVAGCMFVFGVVKGVIDSSPSIDDIDATPTGFLSTVLDCNGNVTATLVATGSNRVYVTIDEIPECVQHAFVAIEDERFYEHNGIDLKGILRAAVQAVVHRDFTEGASTITQQLLKNNVFTTWTTESSLVEKFVRKFQEQYLAVQLEKKVQSKDWILENYLNTINLGQNSLGVQAAARRYFGKDVSELNVSEAAVIAGITQNPYRFNPINYPENNSIRREKVLRYMRDQGYITPDEYDDAMADDVYARIQNVNQEKVEANTQVNSYFVDALTEQVIKDLMEIKGYSRAEANKALYNGGLTIYSTQDANIQKICDEEANNEDNYVKGTLYSLSFALSIMDGEGTVHNYDEQSMLAYYQNKDSSYNITFDAPMKAKEAYDVFKAEMMPDESYVVVGESYVPTVQPQTALTVIDQSCGEVRALVGGRGKKVASRTLNRATGTTRQPGSCFKIIAAFAPALEEGGKTLATVQDDAPYSYANGTSLKNYDGSYSGYTNIRTAIMKSINIVTVKTLTDIGVEKGYEYAEKFGFTTLKETDKVQSIALGGLTVGVTNIELTAAYACIANGGEYIKPRLYTKIVDHNGNVLIDNTPQTSRVIKETTAWLLTDAMKGVLTSEGTSGICHFDGMALAGKSGTTSKDRDMLFAGYSPYYTCVVWGGRDDNSPMPSGSFPKRIWKAAMQRIHEGLEYKDFEMPEGIVKAKVCKKSGLLATEACKLDERGSQVYTEYFVKGSQPRTECDKHILVPICSASHMKAGENCPEEEVTKYSYMRSASAASGDATYLLPQDMASILDGIECPVHNTTEWLEEDGEGENGEGDASGEGSEGGGTGDGNGENAGGDNDDNGNGGDDTGNAGGNNENEGNGENGGNTETEKPKKPSHHDEEDLNTIEGIVTDTGGRPDSHSLNGDERQTLFEDMDISN
ncbi:MAG: penicillin-binding protein [Lachnospiraceae bacterium]|nr:penicillin-binding protein [Lachnospiraceae bacterium]